MDWKNFLHVLEFYGPSIVAGVKPELAPIAGAIVQGAVEAEGMFGDGTGASKLAHVVGVGTAAANAFNAVSGSKQIDTTKLSDAINHGISAAVDTANLITAKANAASPA